MIIDLETPFKEVVKEQHKRVIEMLQMGGDFPQCTEESAISQDWQHVLMEGTCELFAQLRFDENDPVVMCQIRIELAKIVAICERWDKTITEEGQ